MREGLESTVSFKCQEHCLEVSTEGERCRKQREGGQSSNIKDGGKSFLV